MGINSNTMVNKKKYSRQVVSTIWLLKNHVQHKCGISNLIVIRSDRYPYERSLIPNQPLDAMFLPNLRLIYSM